uniref:Orange domain-containing protein n=1 Tax=Oncorhynchus mykiss TaxID=8022 RepID=A0A8C7UIZ3_ONCMY
MAPAITLAVINDSPLLCLQLRKTVGKLHRDPINISIELLNSLLRPEILNQQSDSKLEKANILEMTPVSSSSCSAAVNQGYSRCVQEIVHFLTKDEVKTQTQRRLLSHFQSLHPSSDKNRTCLSSAPQPSISKEKSQVNITLWSLWLSPTDCNSGPC